MRELCETCMFHEALEGGGRDGAGNAVPVGNCMRYPPQVAVNGSSVFPVVGSSKNWCGEHVISPATIEKRATPVRKTKRTSK